ncbi:PREDICTED: LOW QUALITY PROTEIN: dynamin-binding protein-like [Habropoda laboriosa]|uniref:LOW QUALITY PROTEIN: dynamin-binding protein-like n=1 Tax=Habropoda laboriosa TaxID=597456 RepID=UPI00083DE929|nr:PREDICTED: LOW QUALITY PROTEIN: dynamin-binding protein-like [Habropoda laboriosa]
MEPGLLTKVLSDFLTIVDGELSLCKGDHFLVYSVIDKHWCYGESQGKTGKFPSSHLLKVEIPPLHDIDSLYISTAAFPGQQDGDLSFSQGEIIIGVQDVGSGWYLGQIDTRKGIFPLTHVWQLDIKLLKKAAEKKYIRKKAKIKISLEAQLEGELDLIEGQVVTVTETFCDGWCYGITENGKEGTFPEAFISYIDDDTNESDVACTIDNNPTSVTNNERTYTNIEETPSTNLSIEEPAPNYYDLFPELKPVSSGTENSENASNFNILDVKPYAITLYPFNAQFPNELSFEAGEVVHLIKHIDSEWMEGTIDNKKGIFPMSYVNIIVDCNEIINEQNLINQETHNVEYNELLPGTQARVEYTFKAQMDGDLNIYEGNTVTVINMANADWVNVEDHSGRTGLCPRGYISPLPTELSDSTESILKDFIIIPHEESSSRRTEEQKTKRLSEPHRPAPPVPAPGRIPLQKNTTETNKISCNVNAQVDIASNNNLESKQKRADQRQNVISELVITEKEYVRDLKLTYETFNLENPSQLEFLGINVTTLFGNLYDVIQVAEQLLDTILKAMKGCNEELQTVGPCFTQMAEKLKIVYVKYCANHEAALIITYFVIFHQYEDNEEIMKVFNKGVEKLRYQANCFDMSSILIKPVQRILKYPLILYELVKCTDDNHPDKYEVEEAWNTMTAVASHINEYKRRKDLVSKYLDNESTLMRKMAKLSMHSVAKMSTRLSTRLTASLGLTNVAVDPEFLELEKQFRSVEKCILQLTKDVEQCLLYLSEEANSGKVLSDLLIRYYQETSDIEVEKLRDIRSTIQLQFIEELKMCLKSRVSTPLHDLTMLLEGPAVLITKRHHKLLDYDAAIAKREKYKESRFAQDELTTTKSNYEALTNQLLEELPILIDAATKVLTSTQLSSQDILESFLVNHSLLWNQITRFAFAGTNPKIEEAESTWRPQSEKERTTLRNKYSSDKLYVVTENVVSTTFLDMGAAHGTLVAVIKKQDPMGDTSRWFVDNGVAQGFLPSKSLQLQQVPQFDLSNNVTATHKCNSNTSMPDLICMDSPEKECKPISQDHFQELLDLNINEEVKKETHYYGNIQQIPRVQQYQNLSFDFYYAVYEFSANIPGTLPAVKGQALRLVRPHDEKGNEEWWLMEDRYGNKGYIPQNYLSKRPTGKQ